jgi:putative ABC transport system ATP-binding protein
MLGTPSIVFADEPTGALDSASAAEVLGLLGSAVRAAGTTIVMVTHDPIAASHAGRVVFIADGRIAGELWRPSADAIAERMTHLTEFGNAPQPPATTNTSTSW